LKLNEYEWWVVLSTVLIVDDLFNGKICSTRD